MFSLRTLVAALLILVTLALGCSAAGAEPVASAQSVPAPAPFMPAQLPEPAEQTAESLSLALQVGGLVLVVGGVFVCARALGAGVHPGMARVRRSTRPTAFAS